MIIKDREKIKDRWHSGIGGERKYMKARKCLYTDINESVWEWFCQARARNIPLTGRLIQEKAVMFSMETGHDDFTASNGWLDRWKKRFNVKCNVLSGESADVSEETVLEWKQRLPSLCEGYNLKDIFNADETGLYYRAMPTRSMVAKDDTCKGVKISKERITVMLAASGTGEKLPPLIIGKAKKPRSFQGYNMAALSLQWEHNKRAWMTSLILH